MIVPGRDNEVNAVHPLMLAVDEMEKAGVIVDRILLLPLKLSHVNNLIADSLNCTRERAQPLAALVLAKTKGNPFFLNEFLRSLDRENLLYFDYQARIWQWNLESIRAKNITDNLVELLSLEIKKLKPKTRQILQLAACIGNQFEIETLAIVAGNTPQKIALLLREAMITGLVYSLSDAYKSIELGVSQQTGQWKVEYKFVHDRIQQAAYSLIPDSEKLSTHLKIGQLLLKHINPEERERKIFKIVNQLNIGRELIRQQKERYQLARLNLSAGQQARFNSKPLPHYVFDSSDVRLRTTELL